MATARQLQAIAAQYGTPVVVINHNVIRRSYAKYKEHLPLQAPNFVLRTISGAVGHCA